MTEFYDRVSKSLNEDFEICCEMKFDGTSISLTYEHGKLVQAVTRGDGVRGDDVTDNVKTIRTIPLILHGDYPDSFEMRGEILMPWDVFEELNRERELREEPLFANPRNAASGTLKSQNSAVVASRRALRKPDGSREVGIQDFEHHKKGALIARDIRLHQLLGRRAKEPSGGNRRHSA